MPIYEYRCSSGHELEVYQRISDDPVTVCPTCGAKLERLISVPGGFDLRGPGFYVNDYKKAGQAKKTNSGNGGVKKDAGAAAGMAADSRKDSSQKKGSG